MDEAILREVRERFANDRFATDNGAVIEEIGDDCARVSMEIDKRHYNAAGGVMGGAIFTLADFAFAVAANWQGTLGVSQTAQITYLVNVKGKRIIASAKRIKDGRTMCYYEVYVADELGNQVAHVTTSGFHVGKL